MGSGRAGKLGPGPAGPRPPPIAGPLGNPIAPEGAISGCGGAAAGSISRRTASGGASGLSHINVIAGRGSGSRLRKAALLQGSLYLRTFACTIS